MKVRSALKHLFIPHHGNEFKPHFFREAAVATMLFVSVFLLGISFGSSHFIHRTVLGATIASSVLIDLTNESRIKENEPPLLKSDKLERAALLKGEDMVSRGYFAHYSPEGVSPWYWFKEAGYSFLYAGENLAINFTDSSDVEKAWLNSPKHRANIMNASFEEIGIATVPGVYNNVETIYIVQMFGTPAYAEVNERKIVQVEKNKIIVSATGTDNNQLQITEEDRSTIAGDVKGEIVSSGPFLESISLLGGMIVAKNSVADPLSEEKKLTVPTYSTWYDKIVFNGSRYIGSFYNGLFLLIGISLLVMIVVEIRKQHIAHILYGVLLLLLLQLFMYINQSFF